MSETNEPKDAKSEAPPGVSAEVVKLAARREKDEAAAKRQKAVVDEIEREVREILRRHEDRIRTERSKLHELEGALQISGKAQLALEAALPREISLAVDQAEAEIRVLDNKMKDKVGDLRLARNNLAQVEAKPPSAQVLKDARDVVHGVTKEIHALEGEKKKAGARLEAARRSRRAALEAIKKGAQEAPGAG